MGQLAAKRLGRQFLDFDVEIERREGMSVAQIFAERGEPAFRRMEHGLTQELALLGGIIVAPGGGWITNPDNVALLEGRSRMVWLKVRPETAIARLQTDPRSRPLLVRPDPLGELRKLLAQREALYAQAPSLINTEMVTLEQGVERLVALATAAEDA